MEVDDQTMEDHEDRIKRKNMNKTYTVTRNKIGGAAATSSNHDDSLIVIPDTPSPVFSRFVGKRERLPDLDRSRLDFVRKKPKTSNDTGTSLQFSIPHSSSHNNDISSQTGTSSSTNSRNFSKNNGEFSPNLSTKYFKNSRHDFSKDKNESDESSKYFKNLWDECMQDADSVTKTIVKSPKKSLKLKRRKLINFDDKDLNEEKDTDSKLPDRSNNHKSRIETVTQNMDVDVSQEPSRDAGHMSKSQGKELFSNKRQNTEESGISNKFEKLKMARQRKMDRLLESSDSGSSDEFLQLPAPQRKSPPKVRFNNNLCWPSESESESDSDNSDTVPLREIIGENISKKKKNNCKNLREQSVIKNNSCVHKSVARASKLEDSGRNHFTSKKDVKEKYFKFPKLGIKKLSGTNKNSSDLHVNKQENWCSEGQKNLTRDRVRNLSEPNVSIVSISSTDSHTMTGDLSNNFGDTSHDNNGEAEAVGIITSPEFSPLPQDGASSFRPSFVSPRLPVPISVRRGRHADRRPERYVDDIDSEPSIIISSQVQTSSNVSPTARDIVSVSPHLISNRTRSVRSHKGRLSRPPRNVSRERVTSPGTEFTTASALMSPATFSATQQVRQNEADEDFARRLQEEMDMEFALSLHNMENRPPVEHPSGHGSGTTTTTDDDSDTRNEQPRPRMYGLEDIEAFLHMSDDPGPTSNLEQMLRATMTTTPPRTRNRQRGSRRQRNNSSLEALNRMEVHLMSILDEYGSTPPVRGQGRRGRRFFTSPADEGQDYEELLNLAEMIGEVKQKGLTKHQLTKLPERKYQLCPGEDVKECLVCMCEFEDKDKLRILPCFHEFHTPCIDKWIMGNATCPVCRVEVRV